MDRHVSAQVLAAQQPPLVQNVSVIAAYIIHCPVSVTTYTSYTDSVSCTCCTDSASRKISQYFKLTVHHGVHVNNSNTTPSERNEAQARADERHGTYPLRLSRHCAV